MYYYITINKVLNNGAKAEIKVEYEERKGQFQIKRVGIIPKGKRKMQYIGDSRMTDNYAYRCLNTEDRGKVEFKAFVEAVGIDVLNEALSEAWEQAKPKPIDIEVYDIDFDVSKFI